MRKEAENDLTKLSQKPDTIFKLIKVMKKDGKEEDAWEEKKEI